MTSMFLAVLLAADATVSTNGTATLPLSEVLTLLKPVPARPPGELLISKLALKGRPSDSGLWVEGEVSVRLTEGAMGQVDILELGPEATFEELPSSAHAALTVSHGHLSVVARSATSETLPFRLLVRSTGGGGSRSAKFRLAAGMVPIPLRLEVDDALIEVSGAAVVREWGGYVEFPRDRTYTVTWRERMPPKALVLQRRVPVDLLVTEASGRWVSTLEGRATHDVALSLQVDRPAELEVSVPPGQTLLSAKVNSQPVPFEVGAGRVKLSVAPNLPGGNQAIVTLVFLRELGVFHLSGRFELEGPKLSWPVKRWQVSTTLPAVFNYAREGGSMAAWGSPEDGEDSAEGLASEVPGKQLRFTQHRVEASAPTLTLAYSVDISKSYFR